MGKPQMWGNITNQNKNLICILLDEISIWIELFSISTEVKHFLYFLTRFADSSAEMFIYFKPLRLRSELSLGHRPGPTFNLWAYSSPLSWSLILH